MKPHLRLPRLFHIALWLVAVSLSGPVIAQDNSLQNMAPSAVIGQHIVQSGETLFCIGRAYGVLPEAIAQANNLPQLTWLLPGWVLSIPAVQWVSIPPGPVCSPQFVSPFAGLDITSNIVIAPTFSPPIPTTTTGTTIGKHIVQSGETLFCLGRTYMVIPNAIALTNRRFPK